MRQHWRWLAAVFLLVLLPARAARAQSSLARAQTVIGTVTLRRGPTLAATPLASGASLHAGDVDAHGRDTLLALERLEEAASRYRAALVIGGPPPPAPISRWSKEGRE